MLPDPPESVVALVERLSKHSYDPIRKAAIPFVAFRGAGRTYGNLNTGVQRLCNEHGPLVGSDLLNCERRLLDNFRLYAAAHCQLGPTDWDVLALAQHYRLPTRLLDWTSNPYVALFFATENDADLEVDGEVWCVRRNKSNELLPREFSEMIAGQGNYQLLYLRTVSEKYPRLPSFDSLDTQPLLWLEPPSMDQRIINQYAFFSVMPGVESSTSAWLEHHPSVYWRVPVPKHLKREIRAGLDRMNITYRTIYPGLEGVARWLAKAYGPKGVSRPSRPLQ